MFGSALLRHEGVRGFGFGIGCSGVIQMTRDGHRQVGIGHIGVGTVTVVTHPPITSLFKGPGLVFVSMGRTMPPHQEWHHIVHLSHLRLVKHLLLLCLVEVLLCLCLVEVPFRLRLAEVLLLLCLVELLFRHYLMEDMLSLHPARALLFHRSVELSQP